MKLVGMLSFLAAALAVTTVFAATPRMDRTKFQIGAWGFFPQKDQETHVKELAACGVDFAIAVSAYDRSLLDCLAKYKVGAVVDRRNHFRWWPKTDKYLDPTHELEIFKSELDHPAIWMIDAVDEPHASRYPSIGAFVRKVEEKTNGATAFVNLFPSYATVSENTGSDEKSQLGTKTFREYLEAFACEVPLDYLSYDFYLYTQKKDRRPRLVRQMYEGFEAAADVCRRTGKSFWYTPQVDSHPGPAFEPTTLNRLRFQAYSAMAYGAESVAWACWSNWWWTNNVLSAKGELTGQYARLQAVNAELHRLGPSFMRFRNVATHLVGFAGVEGLDKLGVPLLAEATTRRFSGVRTKEGTPLAVGEMVSREKKEGLDALFVVTSGDMFDYHPAVRTVTFRTAATKVRILTGLGEIEPTREPDGACSFLLAENAAALVMTCD